jgi:hypothetical protein
MTTTEAIDDLKARAKSAELKVSRLREALRLLVDDTDKLTHNPEVCSRNSECDEAAECAEECSYCGDACPECECGAQDTQRLAAAARTVLRETGD